MTTPTSPPPPQPPTSTIVNPYHNIPESDEVRLQFYVSEADHIFIKLIYPTHGGMRSIPSILWHKLVTALRAHNILDYSNKNEFEHFINNSVLVDANELATLRQCYARYGDPATANNSRPHGSGGRPMPETARRNDRGRTPRIRKIRPNNAPKRDNIQGGGSEARGEKGSAEEGTGTGAGV